MVTGRYEWVGFTSVNAVRAIREKFDEFGLDARSFAGLKVAAVGGVTAQALRDWGIVADLVPTSEQSARGLLEEWPDFDPDLDPINRVFLPRADIATDTLVAGLQEMGWEVDDVTAYRTVRAAPPAARGARRDQERLVRRRALHVELDGAQPGRHRRQAAPHDRRRVHRPGHRQDRRGARPAGRRARPGADRRGPRRRPRRPRPLPRARRAGGRARPCCGPASAVPAAADGPPERGRLPDLAPPAAAAEPGDPPARGRDPAAPGRARAAGVRA